MLGILNGYEFITIDGRRGVVGRFFRHGLEVIMRHLSKHG